MKWVHIHIKTYYKIHVGMKLFAGTPLTISERAYLQAGQQMLNSGLVFKAVW